MIVLTSYALQLCKFKYSSSENVIKKKNHCVSTKYFLTPFCPRENLSDHFFSWKHIKYFLQNILVLLELHIYVSQNKKLFPCVFWSVLFSSWVPDISDPARLRVTWGELQGTQHSWVPQYLPSNEKSKHNYLDLYHFLVAVLLITGRAEDWSRTLDDISVCPCTLGCPLSPLPHRIAARGGLGCWCWGSLCCCCYYAFLKQFQHGSGLLFLPNSPPLCRWAHGMLFAWGCTRWEEGVCHLPAGCWPLGTAHPSPVHL